MRAVLDSSAGVASVLPEPLKAKAVRLLNEYRKGLHELHAPDIYPVETLNALAKAEVGDYFKGQFVSSFMKVGTFKTWMDEGYPP